MREAQICDSGKIVGKIMGHSTVTDESREGYGLSGPIPMISVRRIEMEEFLTPKELCKLLKVSETWPYKMIQRGRLPHYKIEGVVRFKRSDIETFLEGARVEAKGSRVGKKDIKSHSPEAK